MVSRTR